MDDSVFINTFVLGWWVATQPKVDMGEKLGITVAEIQPLYASIVSREQYNMVTYNNLLPLLP
jgi:hypothetical protein